MALVECFECQKNISEIAVSCPHCGYPVAKKRTEARLAQLFDSAKKFAGYRLDLTTEKFALLKEKMENCIAPISLRRINGIGLRLGSVQSIYLNGAPTQYAFGFLVFTFLFMPILPLGFNIVEPTGDGYRFIGNLNFMDAHKVFGKDIAIQAVTKALLEAALFIGFILGVLSIVFFMRNS